MTKTMQLRFCKKDKLTNQHTPLFICKIADKLGQYVLNTYDPTQSIYDLSKEGALLSKNDIYRLIKDFEDTKSDTMHDYINACKSIISDTDWENETIYLMLIG